MCVREKRQSSGKERKAFLLPEAVVIATLIATSSSNLSAATSQITVSGNELDATLFRLISAHEWNKYFWISFEQQFSETMCSKIQPGWFRHTQSDLAVREQLDRRYHFYLEFYVHCNLVYLHTECPTFLNKRHASWRHRPDSGTCYDCKGLDFKHDASHSPQVGQSRLAVRRAEAEISQQVRGEEKELHLGHSLPQTEPRSSSKWHKGAGGASSSFQEALWNRRKGFEKKKTSTRMNQENRQRVAPGLKLYGSDQTAGSWWAPNRLGMMIVFLGMK